MSEFHDMCIIVDTIREMKATRKEELKDRDVGTTIILKELLKKTRGTLNPNAAREMIRASYSDC